MSVVFTAALFILAAEVRLFGAFQLQSQRAGFALGPQRRSNLAQHTTQRDCRVLGLADACRAVLEEEDAMDDSAAGEIEHSAKPMATFVAPNSPAGASGPTGHASSPRHAGTKGSRLRLGGMHDATTGVHHVVSATSTHGKSSRASARGAAANASEAAMQNHSATVISGVDRASAAGEFMAGPQAPGCPAEGKVIFLHVMKTAGLAVDAFLECQGEQDGWAVMHHDGIQMKVEGDQNCKPSVCTLHGALIKASEPENCGPGFADATVFTVLRDPVPRVWSFYNYLKDQKKYAPYQQHELSEILTGFGTVDLNMEVEPRDRCSFCHTQLFNPMVLYNFVGPTTSLQLSACSGPLCRPEQAVVAAALKEAKKNLAAMQAVYVMEEDLSVFAESFAQDPLLSPKVVSGGKVCGLPHNNPSASSELSPDNTTVSLIRNLNWADIELYEYAKTLPNRVTVSRAR